MAGTVFPERFQILKSGSRFVIFLFYPIKIISSSVEKGKFSKTGKFFLKYLRFHPPTAFPCEKLKRFEFLKTLGTIRNFGNTGQIPRPRFSGN